MSALGAAVDTLAAAGGGTSFVDWSSCLLWGLVASLALVGTMETAQSAGVSRLSIPFMLGTAWTLDRDRARIFGLAGIVVTGWIFAFFYAWGFEELGRATWWIGALAGAFHGALMLTVAMPVLANVHPNMATERQGPTATRWLQPPGFLALNYGRRAPLIALVAHVIYGTILGTFYTLVGAP
jgi:hypothetical protein